MPHRNDEDAILDEVQAFAQAWSTGDARAAAAYFTDDGVRVGALGDVQRGRAELESGYARLLQGPFAGASVVQARGEVRMLTHELAIWQGGMEIRPPGTAAPLQGYVVQVMKKIGGRWLVLESHPKLYPPPRE